MQQQLLAHHALRYLGGLRYSSTAPVDISSVHSEISFSYRVCMKVQKRAILQVSVYLISAGMRTQGHVANLLQLCLPIVFKLSAILFSYLIEYYNTHFSMSIYDV